MKTLYLVMLVCMLVSACVPVIEYPADGATWPQPDEVDRRYWEADGVTPSCAFATTDPGYDIPHPSRQGMCEKVIWFGILWGWKYVPFEVKP